MTFGIFNVALFSGCLIFFLFDHLKIRKKRYESDQIRRLTVENSRMKILLALFLLIISLEHLFASL
ncbi:hypothetical protein CLV25_10665 [Acetobacteroides hydrogenigenes]|uniref:Uncharacterized protein n=1 Tax=Acetobacteroides hydrogenigenes TaxID=979970 RepID=A0A4R2EIK5_9BACT|nr:hypothetical protein CLV25_10665 [Acetobacteroides hydrogenigenes]